MFCIELSFDLVNPFFTFGLNNIIENKFCHLHGRDEAMKILERGGGELVILPFQALLNHSRARMDGESWNSGTVRGH